VRGLAKFYRELLGLTHKGGWAGRPWSRRPLAHPAHDERWTGGVLPEGARAAQDHMAGPARVDSAAPLLASTCTPPTTSRRIDSGRSRLIRVALAPHWRSRPAALR